MTCLNCGYPAAGKELMGDINFCLSCGADLDGSPNRVRQITFQASTKWQPGHGLFTIAQMDELVQLGALSMTTSERETKLRSIQDQLGVCLVSNDGHTVPGHAEIENAMSKIGVAVVKALVSQADYETRNP